MRFASIGSGSGGNGLLIQQGDTCVLLDCGFSLKETEMRLARIALDASQIDAILVTHEHQDHASGVTRLAAKYQIPVLMTYGTMRAMQQQSAKQIDALIEDDLLNLIDSHQAFEIADLLVQPFPVPHDAREPVQYSFSDGQAKFGVLTDTGSITPHIVSSLSGCQALWLECNHDAHMLSTGPYPPSLKQRVAGRMGHLDNQTSAKLLAEIHHDDLKFVIAAHLSLQNNTPDLAQKTLSIAINWHPDQILLADQHLGLDWLSI